MNLHFDLASILFSICFSILKLYISLYSLEGLVIIEAPASSTLKS